MTETVAITRLGHRGDGIAETASGPLYVPFTLPGETVRVERQGERANPVEIVSPSPARTKPICRHFGVCGGCALQHVAPKAYGSWKRDQVATALAQRGIDAEIDPLIPLAPRTRRRAVLTARKRGKATELGYHERLSHRLVDIAECPILVPQIERALRGLAAAIHPLVPTKGEIRVGLTATDTGLDVALEGPASRGSAVLSQIVGPLERLGVARLSIAGDPVLSLAEPTVDIDGIPVAVPPFSFLQATAASEAELGRLVIEGVEAANHVADLYSGIGTFALRLARSARVRAVEGDADALRALDHAAGQARGLKRIETLRRDLARMPLSAPELAAFDAVVFDPPRAGAAGQAEEIARSSVPVVVAVSCNPATLARDLRLLVDGGYRIDAVTPVDQFLFSPHIEVVARLSRD